MRIDVRASSAWPHEAVTLAHRRLAFALARFSGRVRALKVRLTDLNGPRGGLDKHCLVAVHLQWPRRVIVIEDVDADGGVAITRAAERAGRAVSRAIQAAREWRTPKRA